MYVVYEELAAGGMGAVHLGKVAGSGGFARAVAIKRLHAHFAKDPSFRDMLLDEARLAARVRHPNVVPTLDVIEGDDAELLLVMEFVLGESLSRLLKAEAARGERVPIAIASAITCDALHGLHAAHEASSAAGEPLDLVHRDVSPQNVIVGADGTARVVDFGIAKAAGRLQATGEGQIKGKVGYMAPEQIRGEALDRRCDVFGASVVVWELLATRRLFEADSAMAVMTKILAADIPPLRELRPDVPEALEAVVMRGLSQNPKRRFATAQDMAVALATAVAPASARDVATWVDSLAHDTIASRRARIAAIESDTSEPPAASPTAAEQPTQLEGVERAPRPSQKSRTAIAFVAATLAVAAAGAITWRWTQTRAQSITTAPALTPQTLAPTPTQTVAPAQTQAPTPTQTQAPTQTQTPARTPTPVHVHAAASVTRDAPVASSAPSQRKCLRKIPDDAGVLIPTYVPCD